MARHNRRGKSGAYRDGGHPLGHGHSGGRHQHPDGRKFGGGQAPPEGPDDAIASSGFGGTQPHPTSVGGGDMYGGGAGEAPSGGAGGDMDGDEGTQGMALGGM
jgi:hypothetical protein